MIESTIAPAESLRGVCGGRVFLPGDPGYDAARTPWNVAVQQLPAAVAVPTSAEEVAEVVRAAAAAGGGSADVCVPAAALLVDGAGAGGWGRGGR